MPSQENSFRLNNTGPEQPAGTNFSFVLETPDGTAPQMSVSLPGKPIRLSGLVPFMHDLADEIIALAIKKAALRGERVACGPGCGVCCSQMIPLSAPEAFFMVETLLKMPLAERVPYLRRFATIEKRLDETGMKKRICSLNGTDTGAVARDYFYLKEPCPFLVEQSCSIHAWRPIVCREFNAVSDPALCKDPFVNKLRTVPLFKRPSSILALLASSLCGIPAALVPLPLVFDWFEANRELGMRTWSADMLVKKVLEITVEPAADGRCGKKANRGNRYNQHRA